MAENQTDTQLIIRDKAGLTEVKVIKVGTSVRIAFTNEKHDRTVKVTNKHGVQKLTILDATTLVVAGSITVDGENLKVSIGSIQNVPGVAEFDITTEGSVIIDK